MFMVMEIIAFLPKDTKEKACRSPFNRIEAVVDDGCIFNKKKCKIDTLINISRKFRLK